MIKEFAIANSVAAEGVSRHVLKSLLHDTTLPPSLAR